MLHDIWQAETRAAAEKVFDRFVATYEAKYAKAVGCLVKDRAESLVFYDFPAQHWVHVRTTNPIESTLHIQDDLSSASSNPQANLGDGPPNNPTPAQYRIIFLG
jgi:hypothetical protein